MLYAQMALDSKMKVENMKNNNETIGYCIEASHGLSGSFVSFLFFGNGDCFDLCFPLLLELRTFDLND